MKTEALLLSLVMCGIGLGLAYVYWNPWGLVLDGVAEQFYNGFVWIVVGGVLLLIFFVALLSRQSDFG